MLLGRPPALIGSRPHPALHLNLLVSWALIVMKLRGKSRRRGSGVSPAHPNLLFMLNRRTADMLQYFPIRLTRRTRAMSRTPRENRFEEREVRGAPSTERIRRLRERYDYTQPAAVAQRCGLGQSALRTPKSAVYGRGHRSPASASWTAPAERSGDGAFARTERSRPIKALFRAKAVSRSACHRTP